MPAIHCLKIETKCKSKVVKAHGVNKLQLKMSGREIVTLQVGHYSNFVGAHWWNLQESSFIYEPSYNPEGNHVNHDILFREGVTSQGAVTYTPRLVAIDLKGSLNTLNKNGGLYEDGHEEEVKWSEDVTLHEASTGPKNEYLTDLEMESETAPLKRKFESSKDTEDDELLPEAKKSPRAEIFGSKFYELDKGVHVWSDCMRTFLHPKTIHILNEYLHANEEQPFNVYGMGQEIFSDPDKFEEVENKIRFFVEDCDQLQGFHILADTYDGFGGSAHCFLQYLEDEFYTKSRLTFGVTPTILPDSTAVDRSNRIINSALSYEKMSEFSTLFIPLSLATSLWRKIGQPQMFPYLQYKPELHYHTSAILAASIDTLTLPYRCKDSYAHMTDITKSFSVLGRKMASLNTSFPYTILEENQTFAESLMLLGDQPPWQSITPHVKSSSSPNLQSCVVRGISDKLNSCKPSVGGLERLSVEEILEQYLSDIYSNTRNAGYIIDKPSKVCAPFPHIFSPKINRNGHLAPVERLPQQGVDQVPMMTSLQSSAEISTLLKTLHSETSRFNIRKNHRFLVADLDEDGFTDVLDNLQNLASCYESV